MSALRNLTAALEATPHPRRRTVIDPAVLATTGAGGAGRALVSRRRPPGPVGIRATRTETGIDVEYIWEDDE